jgi:hypothetical protein
MSDETKEETPKIKMTKKGINEQINASRSAVEQNIGIIRFCENLLEKADLPDE